MKRTCVHEETISGRSPTLCFVVIVITRVYNMQADINPKRIDF